MKSYKDFILEEDQSVLLEVAYLVEEPLNEKVDIKGWLKKIGLKPEKHGKGILSVIKDSSVHVGTTIRLALKAYALRDAKSKDELKAHLKGRKVSKADLISFVLKLDQLTLHFLTGPLHMIDALTGWEIVPNIHQQARSASDRIKSAVQALDNAKKDVTDFRAKKLDTMLTTLKKMFGIK